MRYADIISENIPYNLGHNMTHVRDLRDPAKKNELDYRKKRPDEYVVLTKDGGAIIYKWANGNIVPWSIKDADHSETVMGLVGNNIDKNLQKDQRVIKVFRNGFLIDVNRDGPIWGGIRGKYSTDLKPILAALIDRGLAEKTTPIWIGDHHELTSVGSIGNLLSQPDIPNRLVLYHGTTNYRLLKIMRTGLIPLAQETRIWKGGSKGINHRDESIYLTSSLNRAEYYAKKAVNVDKARLRRIKWREPWRTNPNIPNPDKMTTKQKIDFFKKIPDDYLSKLYKKWKYNAEKYHRDFRPYNDYVEKDYNIDNESDISIDWALKDYLSSMSPYDPDAPEKVEPVVLKVLLGKADMQKLMADDDHIRHYGADPTDWMDSLSRFGQVAYKGSIPPNRIKVISPK